MGHDELVARALGWLKSRHRCRVAAADLGDGYERPDAMGWRGSATTLVECKASRADFAADARKTFRRHPEMGMGFRRWYLTPPGLVTADEVPDRWGLAEVRGRSVVVVRDAYEFHVRNERAEVAILVSIAARVIEGWGRRPLLVDGDPGPTFAAVLRDERRRRQRAEERIRELENAVAAATPGDRGKNR